MGNEIVRNKVFISYSHKDAFWMEKIKGLLEREMESHEIHLWDDTGIETGQDWEKEINNALATSCVALALVSDDFCASEFIRQKELPVMAEAADKKECVFFWVRIDGEDYETVHQIKRFEAAHMDTPLASLPEAELEQTLTDITGQLIEVYRQKKPLPQIKVLSLTAAPDDDLHYEKEQDTLLEVFQGFKGDAVYLEIPDPVDSTLSEMEERLRERSHDILHLTAHGQMNEQKEGFLCLEDAQGKAVLVTGRELMALLDKLDKKPKMVILTSCHSARSGSGLEPVAETLFNGGIHTVIGMKKAVRHGAAIAFNGIFFQQLCRRRGVKSAFEAGCEGVLAWERRMQRENRDWEWRNESEIPLLLTRPKPYTENLKSAMGVKAQSVAAQSEPCELGVQGAPPPCPPGGPSESRRRQEVNLNNDEGLTAADFYGHFIDAPAFARSHHFEGARHLDRGFIGRRGILRGIYRQVEREGAVVLKGPGGIGKSTLTTRVAAKLRRKGYAFIVVRGETSEADILEKISQKAVADGITNADKIFAAQGDERQKLAWFLDHFLLKRKVVVILDNFEDNQEAGADGAFRSDGLKGFMWSFRDALRGAGSVLMISTRYGLPGFGAETVEVDELSANEAAKLMFNCRSLKALDGKSQKGLRQGVGGNPRVLELLDGIAFREFGGGRFDWEGLKKLFPEMKRRMFEKKGKGDDFTPLMLDMLLGFLTDRQRELLEAAAIYRVPVVSAAIEAQGITVDTEDRLRLEDLSLLAYLKEEGELGQYYYVHRLTAGYVLEQIEAEKRKQAHLRAAEYFFSIVSEDNKRDLADGIETRHHYLQAEEWDKAVGVTESLIRYLTLHGFPRRSLELLEELPQERLSDENRAGVIGEMGSLYMDFGDYDSAVSCYQKAFLIAEADNDLRISAAALHQLGMVHQAQGRYEDAVEHYRKCQERFEELGALKEQAAVLHQLGMVHQDQGRYEDAVEHYRKSMEIAEKIGDINGVASTLHQLGMVHQDQGRYEDAVEHYRKSMESFEKIGDIKGVATTLHQLGMVHQDQGRYEDAVEHYRKSMESFEKIGDIKGVASTLHQLGMVHQDQGRYEDAVEHYRKSMEIKEKIGDIKGVASTLHQLGMVHQAQGRYEDAAEYYLKSMEIAEKTGDISGIAESTAQLGVLLAHQEQFAEALNHFARAFLIFRRLQSPNAENALHNIALTRQKLPAEEFNAILKDCHLDPAILNEVEPVEDEAQRFMDYLVSLTEKAVSAGTAAPGGRDSVEIFAALESALSQLPETPEAEGFKCYFQYLLSHARGETPSVDVTQIPPQLNQIFDAVKNREG